MSNISKQHAKISSDWCSSVISERQRRHSTLLFAVKVGDKTQSVGCTAIDNGFHCPVSVHDTDADLQLVRTRNTANYRPYNRTWWCPSHRSLQGSACTAVRTVRRCGSGTSWRIWRCGVSLSRRRGDSVILCHCSTSLLHEDRRPDPSWNWVWSFDPWPDPARGDLVTRDTDTLFQQTQYCGTHDPIWPGQNRWSADPTVLHHTQRFVCRTQLTCLVPYVVSRSSLYVPTATLLAMMK